MSSNANTPGATAVTVWDLHMAADPNYLRSNRDGLTLVEATEPAPELARFFYVEVGRNHHWHGRLSWSRAQWEQEQARETNHLWTAWRGGSPVGYFVLEEESPDDLSPPATGTTELLYFGLLPRFMGEGIGRWLLESAISIAWSLPSTERLWLHTCSLDGPHARANYLTRGFTQVRERVDYQVLDQSPDESSDQVSDQSD